MEQPPQQLQRPRVAKPFAPGATLPALESPELARRIADALDPLPVRSVDDLGWDGDAREAAALLVVDQQQSRSRRVRAALLIADEHPEAARLAGVEISQPCGGQGRCGRCLVKAADGQDTVEFMVSANPGVQPGLPDSIRLPMSIHTMLNRSSASFVPTGRASRRATTI